MACTCAPTLIVARNELTACFPPRDKSSDGCCPSAAHTAANPKSDHEPGKTGAAKGYSRAYDYDEDIAAGRGPSPLKPLVAHLLKDERTKYVIYEAVLYYPDGTTRKNKGHEGHLHHSIKDSAVHDTRSWHIADAFRVPPPFLIPEPQENDDMVILVPEAGTDKGRAFLVSGNQRTALAPEESAGLRDAGIRQSKVSAHGWQATKRVTVSCDDPD